MNDFPRHLITPGLALTANSMNTLFSRFLCATSSLVAFALWPVPTAAAFDLDGVAIHGSISGTGAYSDRYNYYGDTDGKFDLIQKEITLNGGYRFDNGLRLS